MHDTSNETVSQQPGRRPRVRLTQPVIARAPGLLYMEYAPPELEIELGVPARTLREWLNQGLPHRRDAAGRIWIIGTEFAHWVEEVRRAHQSGPRLKDGEAYCLKCRQGVSLDTLHATRTIHGNQVLLKGICPRCGTPIHRGWRND